MIWFHLVVVVLFIIIGARIGGLGIGLAGGAGVLVLAATGLKVDMTTGIPWTVIGIIIPVVCAVAAMQVAGGMDHLVHLTEVLLRKHPKQINFLGPLVAFVLTMLCGTGHTVYSILPVIVEVSKDKGIRPSRPLSMTVVASQVAIVASPISAATVAITGILAPLDVSYLQVLAVTIPTTMIGCLVGILIASRQGCELDQDPVYLQRKAAGLVAPPRGAATTDYKPQPGAIPSLVIFLCAIVAAVTYSTLVSKSVAVIKNPTMDSTAAIMTTMLVAALLIIVVTKKPAAELAVQGTFKAGMSAVLCILGVAWLGNTFIQAYLTQIKGLGSGVMLQAPWLLAVVLYFAAPMLFSHAATTVAFMPAAVQIGMSAAAILACYPAVANYYLFPNYPTTVAAMEIDDTGSTRVGKFVLDHPFVIPGTASIIVTVALGFLWAPLVLR
jgi:anaerobic C4-dicarboxylate transporter DcuA